MPANLLMIWGLRAALAAGPPSGQALDEARKLFNEGAAAYKAGDYPLALRDFQKSFELSHLGELLFDVGQAQRNLKNWPAARDAYQRYLAEVPRGPSREEATRYLAETQQELAAEANAERAAERAREELAAKKKQEEEARKPTPLRPGGAAVDAAYASSPPAHPRTEALVLGGVGVALGALAVVGLVEALSFQGWQSQKPGAMLSVDSVQSRVNTANTWATVSLLSGIGAGAGLAAAGLTW